MKSKFLTIGGLSALSVTIIANFGFADVSSGRLDTYKANKLIPNEVQIATINSASSESAGVAVFSPDVLSWKSYSNASSAALGKFMDWTREDFEAFFAESANKAEFEDAWNFLSKVGNNILHSNALEDTAASDILLDQLKQMINDGSLYGAAFPCEGLDFTGLNLGNFDLSRCTGLTWQQLTSAAYIFNTKLPAMDFTNADLSGLTLSEIDFSKCTGLTASQLLSSNAWFGAKLPNVDFTDVDLKGIDISYVDFSQCTGLTGKQIASANIPNFAGMPSYIVLSKEQYETMKEDLPFISVMVDGTLMRYDP